MSKDVTLKLFVRPSSKECSAYSNSLARVFGWTRNCISLLFVLETGVDASRSALVLVCAAPQRHTLRLARGRSFTQRENASRSDAPRSAGTIASSLIFPLRFLSVISGWLLKQKHPTDVGCFCFGNRRRHTLPGTCPRHTLCFSSPLATECRARSPARNVFLFAS